MIMLFCRYCKVVFHCPDFEMVAAIQGQQCYITREGVNHKLVGGKWDSKTHVFVEGMYQHE
jgi:hypothetical protein